MDNEPLVSQIGSRHLMKSIKTSCPSIYGNFWGSHSKAVC